MATIAPAIGSGSGSFSVGRVISRSFSVAGSNFLAFFLLALIARLPALAIAFAQSAASTQAPSGVGAITIFLSSLLTVVMTFVLQAALVHGTIVSLNGRKASIVDCLATGVRLFFPVLGISLLVGLGAGLGLILLIIPGIMLAVRWSVSVPVRVAEGPGVSNAIGRSAELTKGHRWSIFFVFLVLVLIAIGISLATVPFSSAARLTNMPYAAHVPVLVSVAIGYVAGAVTALLNGTFGASVYYELRTIKEGVGPEQLAAVFS